VTEMPARLGPRGAALWVSVTESHALPAAELEILAEACRCADRLERLDEHLQDGDLPWLDVEKLRSDGATFRVTVDAALSEARQQQNILKQLIASLRLPDADTGKKPQRRPGAAGVRQPNGSGSVSSILDRARAAKAGA
jgi:hypothetical protein